jgi:hypothetical protein
MRKKLAEKYTNRLNKTNAVRSKKHGCEDEIAKRARKRENHETSQIPHEYYVEIVFWKKKKTFHTPHTFSCFH